MNRNVYPPIDRSIHLFLTIYLSIHVSTYFSCLDIDLFISFIHSCLSLHSYPSISRLYILHPGGSSSEDACAHDDDAYTNLTTSTFNDYDRAELRNDKNHFRQNDFFFATTMIELVCTRRGSAMQRQRKRADKLS